jgi:para-aminobenzoate synthetase component II
MILIIDNYDSFTYNLNQQINNLGEKTLVVKHDQITLKEIDQMGPKKIIISPGPKRPKDAGISNKVIRKYYKTIPILGVCLGHECIGEIFGAKVVHAKNILHGKVSMIYHNEDQLFEGLKNPTSAARYHSLILDEVPKDLVLTAWTQSKEIMGVKHKDYPLYGIQFHPESFLTEEGDKLMKNFLNAK